jgi:hypothetical protein
VGWLPRFGLHLAAALGATGIFVAAAAVGANQTRQNTEIVAPPTPAERARPATPRRTPAVTSTPSPSANAAPSPAPTAAVRPERSIAGTIREVSGDMLVVQGPRGQEFRVVPAPGALIRLNGKAARLDSLQPDDQVVILGQAQPRTGFVAHAITARRK